MLFLPLAHNPLKGRNIGTQADIDGKFTFPISLEVGDVLVISYIGIKDKEIVVKKENDNETKKFYEIQLTSDTNVVMMGEVNTTKIYKSKRTLLHKIKSLFTDE